MPLTSIADSLFTKTQQRVLGLLYGQSNKRFYANEIMRRVNMGRGTVRRELERLVSAGLLTVTREGNRMHYQANEKNPVFHELLALVEAIVMPAEAERAGQGVTTDRLIW